MAHYALLNTENEVISVITGVDEWITQTDIDGTAVGGSTETWEAFYAAQPWHGATSCKRTSYNGNMRKNYAGIGYTYDTVLDAFYAPKPYPSWILDETTCQWEAPVPMPVPNNPPQYVWDEATLGWVETPTP